MKKVFLLLIAIFVISIANAQWVQTNPDTSVVSTFATKGDTMFCGGEYSYTYNNINQYISKLYLSTDDGDNWTVLSSALTDTSNVNVLAISGNNIILGTYNGMYLSSNYGNSWEEVGFDGFDVIEIATSGDKIFAACIGIGVYLSSDNGSTWTAINNGLKDSASITTLSISGNNIFAGTDGGVYISTNNGSTWTAMNTSLTSSWITSLVIGNNIIIAGTINGGVFISTNNASNWTPINTGLPNNAYVKSLVKIGNNIFAGISGYGVYMSNNNGSSWAPLNTNFKDSVEVLKLAIYNKNIYAGTFSSGVWKHSITNLFPSNAGIISGPNNVCKGQTMVYTVPPIDSAIYYIWILPNGNIDSTTTNSITVNFDSTSTSGYIIVKGTNNCGQGNESSMFVYVAPLPIMPNIIGVPNPQPFSMELYSVSQQLGKTYNWTVTNGNILNGTGTNYINVQWGNTGTGQVYISIADSNNTNCISSSSLTVNIGNLGIETIEDNNGIYIYPNPTKDNLTIETNSNKEQRLEIVNLFGQTTYITIINNKKTTVNTSAFAKGVYILKLSSDKETVVRKFVKE